MNVYFINDPSQFSISQESLYSLSNKCIQELKQLSKETEIIIDICNLENIVYISKEFLIFKDEQINQILQNQVSTIMIHHMSNLQEISNQAFYQIGSEYSLPFTFSINSCPKLEMIGHKAFSEVGSESPMFGKREYTLSFRNCPKLSVICFQAFMGLGYKAENIIGIDFSENKNLEIIDEECFYQAFHNSEKFKFIKMNNIPNLESIYESAFDRCGEYSNNVLINISDNKNLKLIQTMAFDDVGQKRTIDITGDTLLDESFINSYDQRTTKVIKEEMSKDSLS